VIDPMDMSTPVTRGELREELKLSETRLEARLDGLESRFDRFEQELEQKLETLEQKLDKKFDQKLDQKLEALEQKLEQKFDQKLAQMATKADLEIWGGALLERLSVDLARHVKAIQEQLSIQVSTIDDKYADLPGRVSHLEAVVLAPTPR
jgi:hypothetical protein